MKNKLLSFLNSVKGNLLVLLLVMTVIALSAYITITISAITTISQRAQDSGTQALQENAQTYLVQLNHETAAREDLLLEQAMRDVQAAVSSTQAIFEDQTIAGGPAFWKASQHMQPGAESQYINGPEDISSVFVPNFQTVDGQVIRDVELSAYLDLVFPSIFENNPYAQALYFATPREMVRYYPNINLGKVLPADFTATQRVWFQGSTAENDPQHKVWWTPVYLDATGLGLITTAAMPVYTRQGEMVGVVGFDISLDEMRKNVESMQIVEGGYAFLLDSSAHAIALPERGYLDILGRESQVNEVHPDMSTVVSDFGPVIQEMLKGNDGFLSIEAGGRELLVAFSPLKSTGWNMAIVVPAEALLPQLPEFQFALQEMVRSLAMQRVVPITGFIIILLVLIGLIWADRLVTPIQQLASAAERIGTGDWNAPFPRTRKDEVGSLAQTIFSMKEQLRTLVTELEERVSARTHDLERRTQQLQIAAEVARDITTPHTLEELLENAVEVIRTRFGFYHAGIFLVDEDREYAVLRAATGEVGRQMLEQNHKLKVAETGLVGYTVGTGKPQISMDVAADAIHFKNPLLPETRSELALPLISGGQVIGALNVQSREEAAFSPEDITLLQTVSDQLATAIQNARLVARLENTLTETRMLYQQQVEHAWRSLERRSARTAFEYDRLEVKPHQMGLDEATQQALQRGESVVQPGRQGHGSRLLVPVLLRNQVIGVIGSEEEDPEHIWSADEISLMEAVASQAALTLENARLLEEARFRADREHLAGEISARMRATNDPETILQTAVRELRQALGARKAQVLFQPELEKSKPDEDDGNGKEQRER